MRLGTAIEQQAASTNTLSRFETEVLTREENVERLAHLNAAWVAKAMTHTPHRRVILDMDSSESPVYGAQEGAAYNGHFACMCYHHLFCFNQFGDCEGAMLRHGNEHSAHCWRVVLEKEIEPLLKRPVGRPPEKPIVRYHDFFYQAASWKYAWRVVAMVEWHQGELFPRVGFIVTNLWAKPEGVVHFYNGRGIAEQWIKEGKYALKWTRLSCHRFVANQVRLQLFILAYNMGNFLRRLALPKAVKEWSLQSVQLKLIKTGARLVRHARRLVFQMAEVAVPGDVWAAVLGRISGLRLLPG